MRRHRHLRRAAALQLVALVVFLAVGLPVNGRFPVGSRLVIPSDWQQLRDRWEAGHPTGFVLFLAALLLWLLGWPAKNRAFRNAVEDPSAQ